MGRVGVLVVRTACSYVRRMHRSTMLFMGAVACAGCREPTVTQGVPAEFRTADEPAEPTELGKALAEDGGASTGDHMHLVTGSVSKDVWTTGWASIPHASHPEYAFAGPLGCAGQRFKTKLTRNTRLDIGYTAQKAFVIVGEQPYVLAKPPSVEGKSLVWSGDFLHVDGTARPFTLRIDCPLPAK